jgi:hypothetical protein
VQVKSRIRGLSLSVTKGQAVLASRADDHVCAAEIVLLSTNPKSKEATIEVRPGGAAKDMRVLGMKPGPQTFTLSAATCVEVLPGLLMGVGVPDAEAAIRSQRARLVFKDPPHLWHIERQTSLQEERRVGTATSVPDQIGPAHDKRSDDRAFSQGRARLEIDTKSFIAKHRLGVEPRRARTITPRLASGRDAVLGRPARNDVRSR